MKKILFLTMMALAAPIALIMAPSAEALPIQNTQTFKNSGPSKIGVFKEATTEKLRVRKLIRDLNYYSNKHDIEKIKPLYSVDFKSSDGFSYDEFFEMAETSFNSYQDIKYNVKIKNIKVEDDNAAVRLFDKTTAKLVNPGADGSISVGDLEGFCDYIAYLRKENGSWKIISDHIITEETALKYGDAKSAKMQIASPEQVEEDSEYSILLKVDHIKDTFIIASLNREEITFPPTASKENFRKLSPEGDLERLVRSNKNGINEYAVASIGFTRLHIDDDLTSLKFQMSGLAFLMNRVNVNSDNSDKAAVENKRPKIIIDGLTTNTEESAPKATKDVTAEVAPEKAALETTPEKVENSEEGETE